jgi:hypothetical protein
MNALVPNKNIHKVQTSYFNADKSLEKFVSYNQFALDPISHIPDTNFWHYSIQLNTYKLIIERKYGYKII